MCACVKNNKNEGLLVVMQLKDLCISGHVTNLGACLEHQVLDLLRSNENFVFIVYCLLIALPICLISIHLSSDP